MRTRVNRLQPTLEEREKEKKEGVIRLIYDGVGRFVKFVECV